jgi:hypothetical protein
VIQDGEDESAAMKPGQVLYDYLDFYCGIFENHEACMKRNV